MPEMDGKKCLSEILHINPKAKVLIASGHSETSPSVPRLLPGAKALVQKPYEMRKLLQAVREVLDAEEALGIHKVSKTEVSLVPNADLR